MKIYIYIYIYAASRPVDRAGGRYGRSGERSKQPAVGLHIGIPIGNYIDYY